MNSQVFIRQFKLTCLGNRFDLEHSLTFLELKNTLVAVDVVSGGAFSCSEP